MGNVTSNCCPSRRPSAVELQAEGYGAADNPPQDAPAEEALPPYRMGFWEYWEGTWDLFHKICPAAVANGMESYEGSLYSSAIPQITILFFADSAELAWLCFAVPFFTKPIGGLLGGFFGDSFGRRNVVIVGAYGMLSTIIVQGMIPSSLGTTGGFLLVFLRVVEGLFLGVTSTMNVYAAEMCPRQSVAKGIAIMNSVSEVGTLTCVGFFTLLNAVLSSDQMVAWGWRLPYMTIILPGLWSAIRAHELTETPDFNEAREQVEQLDQNLWNYLKAIFTEFPINSLLYMGLALANLSALFSTKTYMIDWLPTYTGVSEAYTMSAMMVRDSCCLVMIPLAAYLADQFGPTKVMLTIYSTVIVAAVPAYALVLNVNPYVYSMVLEVFFGIATMSSVSATVMGIGLLPTEVRATTTGLLSTCMSCVFGGMSPAFLTWLSTYTPMAPAFYIVFGHGVALMTVVSALVYRDNGMKLSYMREEPF